MDSEPIHNAEDVRPQWRHKRGDQYVVLVSRAVGNPHDGFDISFSMPSEKWVSLDAAIREGFRIVNSDDFNIGAIRGGKLAARLWMKEVIENDPVLMAEIADEVGLDA